MAGEKRFVFFSYLIFILTIKIIIIIIGTLEEKSWNILNNNSLQEIEQYIIKACQEKRNITRQRISWTYLEVLAIVFF